MSYAEDSPEYQDYLQQLAYYAGNPEDDKSYGMHAVDGELEEQPQSHPVECPSHYVAGRRYEPLAVIEDWDLGFHLGNVLKYISRAGRKGDRVEDLKKARFYLDRHIENLESGKEDGTHG